MNHDLSKRISAKLKQLPNTAETLSEKLKEWLIHSNLLQRFRINPYHVAEASGVRVEKIISELLRGVKAKLFDLYWDIHCPRCNLITTEYAGLADVSGVSFCPICEIYFEVDFSHSVEVTFSLNKEIENPKLRPISTPPPVLIPKFQMWVSHHEMTSAIETLDLGRYRYYCPLTLTKGILVVEGEKSQALQEIQLKQLPDRYFDKQELTVHPGKVKIELTNVGHQLSGFVLHRDELPKELMLDQIPFRLSGLQIIHFPEYQYLFKEQVLSSSERLKIRSLTIMFTDITGCTSMYEKLGDAKAYNLVCDHFEILFRAIERQGGRIVKTIGDCVMASFLTNEQAIKAATNALASFKDYNKNHFEDEQINLKIGIHRGAAMLVNFNNSLDYFGTTVNKASRIQGVSKAGGVAFSEDAYDYKSFSTALEAAGVSEIQIQHEDLKGLTGKQVVYTVRIGVNR